MSTGKQGDHIGALVGQARLRMRDGEWEEAATDWEAVLKQDARLAEAYAGLAITLLRRGRHDRAASVLSQGLGALPGDAPRVLAVAIAACGHPSEAREVLDGLLSLRPEWSPAWLARADLEWELEQYAETDETLIRGLGRIPGSAPLLAARARCASLRGNWPAALNRWEDVRKRHPRSIAALAGRIRSLRHLGRLEDAERELEKALDAHPDASPLREECAQVRAAGGDWEAAAEQWRELIRVRPDHEPARWNYTESLRHLGRGDEADEMRRRWLEQHPAHPKRLRGKRPTTGFAQLGQDLWVLQETGFKTDGYFVDLGACDGVYLSNTYLLETSCQWSGICAEPNRELFRQLRQNRSCVSRDMYVFSESGRHLSFLPAGEYGTATQFADSDMHHSLRRRAVTRQYDVRTISLNDLLEQEKAPSPIEYISIDTEGSEYDILRAFDFDRWTVLFWTVEHNYTENRRRIAQLMEGRSYTRISKQWEDWYRLPEK